MTPTQRSAIPQFLNALLEFLSGVGFPPDQLASAQRSFGQLLQFSEQFAIAGALDQEDERREVCAERAALYCLQALATRNIGFATGIGERDSLVKQSISLGRSFVLQWEAALLEMRAEARAARDALAAREALERQQQQGAVS